MRNYVTLKPALIRVPVKIVLYSANFWPEPVGIGKYSGEMAEWLTDQGHEVRVVAAPPYYPGWRIQAGYRWPPFQRERFGKVVVRRAPLWVPKSPSGTRRVLHLLSFAVASLPSILSQAFWRPDVVITVAPAFVCAPAGWLAARLCGAQAWLHVQDFEIDIAFQLGMLKSRLLQRLAHRIERWMLRRFDNVSSISHRMVERLVAKGVAKERTRFFPNWVDVSQVGPFCSGESYRSELHIPADTTVVLYSGTLGAKQGLLVIPQIAERLAHRRDILLVICGEGAMKSELQARTQTLSNVRLIPLQPFERLGDLLSMADIHLLPQGAEGADLMLPSKLSGMLASGRPVVATCAPDTELASVVSQCGLIAAPENAEQATAAILRLVDDSALRARLGRHARAWAEENLDREATLGRVFASLDTGRIPAAAEEEQPVALPEES